METPQSVALIPEEQRYKLLLDAVTDYAIYLLDADGRVTSWNVGAQRITGYAPQEILGQPFAFLFEACDREADVPAQVLAAAAASKYEREEWHIRKDGSKFWAHGVIDPIRGPAGEVIGYANITRDLTAQRTAEAALRRNQELFRLLVQGVTDYAIYLIDLDGRIASWNAGAQRIKGYLPDEVIGQHFGRFYRNDDRLRGDPERALQEALRQGRFESEGWRVRKDGSRFWASVVIDPVHDDDGKVIGFAKVTRDVTEKRAAQQALDAARESLFQSQKLEAIGQLTGGVAHDFNNVLMVILSSLQLIQRRVGEDDALLVKMLQNAINATRRGASLTQRMLAFARRQDLNPKPTNLKPLIENMRELLQRSLGPSIDIRLHTPEGLPPALVDENQLELSLLNLAVNARDAMPNGGPLVIALQEEKLELPTDKLGAGHFLKISVIDTGMGMDLPTLARAMEPFFTTKGVGKGTGLGLSMVDGLASQSGGQFVLKSHVGEGTIAELWLPVAPAKDLVARADAAADLNTTKEISAPRRSLRILLVDDDPLVLDTTAALLVDLGHQVVSSPAALEALKLIRTDLAFDLVLTDQAMPYMTGTEFLAVVKSMRPAMPTIIATGYADMDPNVAIPAHTIKLSKPFDQAQLATALDAAQTP